MKILSTAYNFEKKYVYKGRFLHIMHGLHVYLSFCLEITIIMNLQNNRRDRLINNSFFHQTLNIQFKTVVIFRPDVDFR